MTDVILETVRALILLGIVIFLWNTGRRSSVSTRKGWNYIIAGFGLLLMGSLVDITDNFEELNRFVIIGDTPTEAFLEKFVGFLGGFCILAIGLVKWIPSVQRLSDEIAERTRAEKALMDSEARLRAVFDNTPVCMNLKDTEGRYLLANKRYEEWWGCSVEEAIGKKSHEFQGDGFRVDLYTAAEQVVLETGKAYESEIQIQRPQDNGQIQIHDRLLIKFPVKSSDGTITALGTIAVDITKRKKAEEALRKARNEIETRVEERTRELTDEITRRERVEEELRQAKDKAEAALAELKAAENKIRRNRAYVRSIFDQMPFALTLKDIEGRYIVVNKTFGNWFQKNPAEMLGCLARDLNPIDQRDMNSELETRVIESREPHSVEYTDVKTGPDGEIVRELILTKFPLIEDGELTGISTLQIDVTERKKAEESRRKSEQLLKAAIEGMPEGFAYFDEDDRLALVNKRFVQFYPMLEDVIKIGTPYEVVLRTGIERGQFIDPQGRGEEFFKERFAHHRDPHGAVEFIMPDDRCIRVEESKLPGGGIVGIRTDITEIKRAEEEKIRQYQKMDVLGQLTGSVAHDFNNVLTVLDCNINLLKSQNSNQKQQHSLINDCIEAVEMGTNLTSRLTKFARKDPLAETRVDLNAWIDSFGELLNRSVGKGISIEYVLPADTMPVLVDATLLGVALLNLVMNARDAMPKGGKITVSLNETNIDDADEAYEAYEASHTRNNRQPYALLQVSDTGTGMPPEIKERIFEAFFTTKDEGKGTGLGLNTVQDLAQSTGGFVQIESEPGQGTDVKIFFPLYEEALS